MEELHSKSTSIYMTSIQEPDDKKKYRYTNKKEYDPYQFGNIENPIDYWGSVFHLIRSTIGTGILIIPFAFKSVGWGIGLIGCVFIGVLYMNTAHALLFTEYELCKRLKVRNLTFVSVVHETFALCPKPWQKLNGIFKFLMYFYYGVPIGNAIYMIIIASNVKGVLDHMYGSSLSLQHTIMIIIVPVTLLCLIPKLKFLVPFSLFTNIFTILNVVIILYYSMNTERSRDEGDVKPIESINNIPQFFSMILQALYVTGIILPLKNNMGKPIKFAKPCGVMNLSFIMIIVLYSIFGLVAYLSYGADVEENILLNLPPGRLVTSIVYILYSLALSVTYTLLFYVYFDTIWTNVVKDKVSNTGYEKLTAYGLRLSLSILAFIMAIAIPDFALLTTIVGTIGILLEVSLPAILQIILLLTNDTYDLFTMCKFILKDTIILLLAGSMFIMSFKHCIQEIIEMYSV